MSNNSGAVQPLVYTFTIDTELAKSQLLAFPKFIRERLAFGQLPGIRMTDMEALVSHEGHYVEFKAGPSRGEYEALVRVFLTRPLRVEVRSNAGRNETFERQLSEVLFFSLQFFEEHARESTLYLTFVPGSPRTAEVRPGNALFRPLFSGNIMNIFLLSILIGLLYFMLFEELAPFLLLLTMLALVLSAGRLSSIGSPWRITKEHREVLVIQYKIPQGGLEEMRKHSLDKIKAAKRKAYELFSGCPGTICSEKMAEVFNSEGIPAKQENFLVRRIDLYGMVERIAKRFGMPVPTIVILHDPRPNAAATGFTKHLATMLVTAGLLVQLEEEEIEIVIGHELSHLRSGDPVVLFSLVAAEYLLRVYVYWQYIAFLWVPYFLIVFWGIFFFGKFLESRADLEAGLILGKPKVMAEALKKIGFRRLVLEERFLEPGVSRLGEWMRFDPHPPLYFRIRRLEQLDTSNPPKHPFLSSVKAVASGFISSTREA